MAQHKSTKKRIVLSAKQNERNRAKKSALKSSIKKVFATTDKESAVAEFKKTSSLLDKMTVKKILPKNRAARKKSQLASFVNSIK